ncbi:MAG: outer membrane beta-barrel protein [Bacteroidota bacterium]
MKRKLLTYWLCAITGLAHAQVPNAQKDTTEITYGTASGDVKVPFEGMNLTWINGQSRIKESPLVLTDKNGETILTGTAYMDAYYNYNFANPNDNTQTISSAIGRHNETSINLASFGIESYYKNCIGRLWLQYGSMQHIVQELDASVNRGRNTGTGNLKFIREAAAGYHFNKWHGINIEAGIFMSYIGLESYMLQDNWSYQRSMVCDFTPFYFQGARVQMFPSKKLKQEIWVLNGWQTYNSYSKSPGLGSSTYWRPNENIQLVANFYLGRDTQNPDTAGNQSNRIRFHHDNSVVARYFTKPESKGISQAAFSLNTHYGFQKGTDKGDNITAKEHFMIGTSLANRIWFNKNKFALTLRGDVVSNGGNYLAFSPSPVTPNDYTDAFASNANKPIQIFQGTVTFDIMPNDYVTFRFEYGHRNSNIPYFTGPAGTTSPSGWVNGPATVNAWRPDLGRSEDRVTVAVNFRL